MRNLTHQPSRRTLFVSGTAAFAVMAGAATTTLVHSDAASSSPNAAASGTLTNQIPGPATTGPIPVSNFRDADSYALLRSDASAQSVSSASTTRPGTPVESPAGVPAKITAFMGDHGPCIRITPTNGTAGTSCSGEFSIQPPSLSATDNDGHIIVAGLAPDNVSKVTVHLADGSSGEAAVKSNVYAAVAGGNTAGEQFVTVPGFGK